eukprot:4740537-Pyramimonas_sp.AAC.1
MRSRTLREGRGARDILQNRRISEILDSPLPEFLSSPWLRLHVGSLFSPALFPSPLPREKLALSRLGRATRACCCCALSCSEDPGQLPPPPD